MKKRLFIALGPVIIALFLLVAVYTLPVFKQKITPTVLHDAAVVSQKKVKRNDDIYRAAMADKQFIPFVGSSELQRYDAFHPAALADKYNRNYTPFLIGQAGTQSLSHYLTFQAMGETLERKKMVFFISPQWFVKKGVSKGAFNQHFSTVQAIDFINNNQIDATEKSYVANRLLQFGSLQTDAILTGILTDVSNQKELSAFQVKYMSMKASIISNNKAVFGGHMPTNSWNELRRFEKVLPANYDVNVLKEKAETIATLKSSNNEFGIKNSFYKHRIAGKLKALAGSQAKYDYLESPEYADFQLVLQELARRHVDVQFVVTPVNARWAAYTGLSTAMLDDFSTKINYQLSSQGFDVIDLTKKRDTDCYLQDTIHLGWLGWVDLDEKLKPFLETATTKTPEYHIDSYFITPEWKAKRYP
ncbi:D-alanyl-lipoteichoic acid biosynthesis protein DltD [Brochothrix campestris]|uniref:Protein DltD n=1 Tax=Brochothrix campestris FSL F6-1037 TaxID=1265861 RepID=W7CS92_9LIST|nr:D-alanyl-lipoteichoic acid biosynthesis protein DltD [Brochothrix campestris]EUJ39550.1 dltD C-terminal region family protein [Brochothrix campestris FSL F6-1037]